MDLNQQVRKLFEQAWELDPGQIPAFLDQHCVGDSALRDKVEALLAADQAAGTFLAAGDEQESDSTSYRFAIGHILAGRYLITAHLGKGGMGEVYQADDQELDRPVAIKTLHQTNLSNRNYQDRFEREMKAVAALNHSNIVTLHDVGRDGDTTFAIMEFVEGQTLRELIKHESLDSPTILSIALGIAAGLRAAHDRDLMHRDIKPENIIVTPDQVVKLLDFGIARPESPSQTQLLTAPAQALGGTAPYMSPEQVEGTDLTCATDIFSFGTVLYEMLTGTNPFLAENAFLTMQRVQQGKVTAIRELSPDTPADLEALVQAMFSPAPSSRPPIADITTVLTQLHTHTQTTTSRIILPSSPEPLTPTTGTRPSIAVLPLQVIAAGDSPPPYGDALAQEIIVDLSKLHSLFVIARGSAFQFRDRQTNLSEIGRILGARYILTGTIEVFGSKCAVSVELAQATDGQIIWAERYEGASDDLLQLRQTISAQVVLSTEQRIQQTEGLIATRLATENLDAWSAYHRGLWHMYRFTQRDNDLAADLFQRALKEDPHFARAHAGLSFIHFQRSFLRLTPDLKAERLAARTMAEQAMNLDPLDPFVNLTMGRAEWIAGDLDSASSWLNQSLQIAPSYAFSLYNSALLDNFLNDGQQSEEKITKAITLSPIDPLSYAMHGTRALSHIVRGEFEEAVVWADKGTRHAHSHSHMFAIAAFTNHLANKREAATRNVQKLLSMDPAYTQQSFFDTFSFQNEATLQKITTALTALNIPAK